MQLTIRNWQRTRKLHLPLLRRMVKTLLTEHLKVTDADLGIFLVAESEMTRLNENFLRHAGSTDVITFDYAELETRHPELETSLHGEIFVCVDEAVIQARKFRTSWQSEVVRYAIHGILHLLGYDDLKKAARRKMKAQENQWLRQLAAQFDFRRLDKARRASKLPA